MAANKTSLSAGAIIRAVLLQDREVAKRVNKIFPVITGSAELPYIVYRRADMEVNLTKAGQPGADTVQIEVICFAAQYGESVEIAEAVRAALDGISAHHDGMVMRSCSLVGGQEDFENDAFYQHLIFNVKI